MGAGIDLDPMIAHGGVYFMAGGLRNDYRGRLVRHMAIDAVGLDLFSESLCNTAALPLMACQATVRVGHRRSLLCMRIVACGAGHIRRRLKATTALQQTYLVSVYIGMLDRSRLKGRVIVGQWLSRHVRKCRCERLALNAVMTPCA